jgi:hypothetical protein
MFDALSDHLDQCRRRGLIVDEAFERGVPSRYPVLEWLAVLLVWVCFGVVVLGGVHSAAPTPRRIDTTRTSPLQSNPVRSRPTRT